MAGIIKPPAATTTPAPKNTPDEPVKATTNKSVLDSFDKPTVVNEPLAIAEPEQGTTAVNPKAKPDSELTESDILTDAVVAVDISLPNFMDVQPKDKTWVFRWVNRDYHGEGGDRYQQMKGIGFVNVESADEIEGSIAKEIEVKDGTIQIKDCILMKINRRQLYGIYKSNLIKANRMHSSANVHREAKAAGDAQLKQDLNATGVPASVYKGKVGIFIPPKVEGDVTSSDLTGSNPHHNIDVLTGREG